MIEKVTIIVPAHEEEQYIGNLLSSLQKLKGLKTPDFEIQQIVVVDDGSQDRTSEIARQHGFPVIRLRRNYGKAFAFYKGAQFAQKNGSSVLVTLDADLESVSPEQIRTLVYPVVHTDPLTGKPLQMTIGTVLGDTLEYSGQRAIRMATLNPLLTGNKKWEKYFGIRHGRFIRKIGYGLEQALNLLIDHGKARMSMFVPNRITVNSAHADFKTQKDMGQKTVFTPTGTTLVNYIAKQDGQIVAVQHIQGARKRRTQRLKKMRQKGKLQEARELSKRRIRTRFRWNWLRKH